VSNRYCEPRRQREAAVASQCVFAGSLSLVSELEAAESGYAGQEVKVRR
jgi:hypothetical protein